MNLEQLMNAFADQVRLRMARQSSEKDLEEKRNVGQWLESRIHLSFTNLADDIFGDGRLTREERITLSGGIGAALDAFRQKLETDAPGLYERDLWEEPPAPNGEAMMAESSIEDEFVPLVERAVREDGTIPLKIIQPGWGSSGFYPAEVLRRDGPTVFKSGTKMFWNHQTPTEEAERPEGDLDDLAAVLTSDALWDANGVDGPGLYASAKVFERYKGDVDDLAPHMGVSIRATGRARTGEQGGRSGPIIEQLVAAKSVDFVTAPGAGGRILEMFEAAGRREVEVDASAVDTAAGSQNSNLEESEMDKELLGRLEALEAQVKQSNDQNEVLRTQLAEANTQNGRLQERITLGEAAAFVNERLAEAQLPQVTRQRIARQLAMDPVVGEDGRLDAEAYDQRIKEAVEAEQAYLQEALGVSGAIVGMGGQTAQPQDDATVLTEAEQVLTGAFQALGMSEKAVGIAVKGR